MQHSGEIFMNTAVAPLGRREKRKLEIRLDRDTRTPVPAAGHRGYQHRADLRRRTGPKHSSHYSNKHALLGGSQASPDCTTSPNPHARPVDGRQSPPTCAAGCDGRVHRFNPAEFTEFDQQLILIAPSIFAEDVEQQREIGNSASASFTRLITAGRAGNRRCAHRFFTGNSAMVVGTLNMLTTSYDEQR